MVTSATGKLRTGVASAYEDEGARERTRGPETYPGLVLLYAPNYEQYRSAYLLDRPEAIMGRDAANHIFIPDQAASRQHARISQTAEGWTLTDLSSRNGTMIAGAFVTERALSHLDEIRVGDAIFKFVDTGAERFTGYRIDGTVFGERRAKLLTELVGGAQIDGLAADIERIAPTELSCMILGETGTGKEVVARGLHRASGRRGGFQAINCAAIPQNLLESELFGYRRGAFSGADRDKPGLIKLADGGTLFLDEIGDMPLDAQAKLLRVLQSREVFPLGGTTAERVDIRVVCATHRDLYAFVQSERFRGDLFARLNDHAVTLPPLRSRKEDIYLLAKSFAGRYGHPGLAVSFSAMVAMLHYAWPFNVRELESCIKRGIALGGGVVLDVTHLPEAITAQMKAYGDRKRPSGSAGSIPPAGPDASQPPPSVAHPGADQAGARPSAPPTEVELRNLLERHQGNVAAVGRELGKERMQIHRWLKRFGITLDKYR
ncbi:MAG: sigma 54-interacting transcriptional regulator [Myxococcales bacterium]|nr:sigma 54-interacting transcriptional regulator [Myxococcales bacterium]